VQLVHSWPQILANTPSAVSGVYSNGTLPSMFLILLNHRFDDVIFQIYSPHFIAVCQPENFAQLCPLGGPPTYITDYKCTGSDEKLIRESR
jgi:hypothetical protein